MSKAWTRLVLSGLILGTAAFGRADDPAPAPAPRNAAEIQAAHDRALVRDLSAYVARSPKADDLDQAYMAIFDKVIEHDWFAENEAVATAYLAARPEGPVRALALIVASMARAHADDFDKAFERFRALMTSVGKPDQEEFATNFSDSLAAAATGSGHYPVARKVYQSLLERYPDSGEVRDKVKDALARLDMVGKPAPGFAARDVKGEAVRLEDFRGQYVLVDFWATWCAPCVAELPRVQAAYAKYHGRGFEVLGVSLDESKEAVTDFVKARDLPWRQLHNAGAGADLVEAFGVHTIPATFLVDPRGVITRLELRGPALDSALAKLLGPAGDAPRTARRTR